MSNATKHIRFIGRAGDPRSGVIIQPGTVTDFPEVWADRYIAQGLAEEIKPDETKPKAKKKK
jgi:hypothetical protein